MAAQAEVKQWYMYTYAYLNHGNESWSHHYGFSQKTAFEFAKELHLYEVEGREEYIANPVTAVLGDYRMTGQYHITAEEAEYGLGEMV